MKQVSVVLILVLALALPLAGCLAAAPPEPAAAPPESSGWGAPVLPEGRPLQQAIAALRHADQTLLGDLPASEVPRSGLPLVASALAFARDHGHAPTPGELAAWTALDLPPRTAAALVDLLEAFRHLEATTQDAFAGQAAPDHARIVAAQHAVAEAAVRLDEAVSIEGLPAAKQAPLTIGTVLALDFTGADDTYSTSFVLVIEMGGHDTYRNNAGGNAFSTAHCSSDSDPLPRVPTAAGLIDLAGDDHYEPGRDCGTTGGGAYGVGMLVDAAGNDTYAARGQGVNGGGYAYGVGLLLDAAGSDVYTATGAGVSGGGYAGGTGRLIDLRGNDSYTGSDYGANGGARGAWHCVNSCQEAKFSLGILLDLGGTDSYWDMSVRGTDRTVIPKETTGMQIDLVLTF